MCGIFFSLGASGPVLPNEETCCLLRERGPDSFQVHRVRQNVKTTESDHPGTMTAHLTFVSTVLSMRGDHVVPQPLVDATTQSVLCWNGDAWKIADEPIQGNDTELVFKLLLEATRTSQSEPDPQGASKRVENTISSISGPFAFVFYDAVNSKLFFSRDCLGRRSLLQGVDDNGAFKICSLCDGTTSTHFDEVECDGVYVLDFDRAIFHGTSAVDSTTNPTCFNKGCIQVLPWASEGSSADHRSNPIPPMNKSIPEGTPPQLTVESGVVKDLQQNLLQSLSLRIQNVRDPPMLTAGRNGKIAVLFSGGLDCTLLARLSHELLPSNETIDLLNVAFENPRVAAAAAKEKEATLDSVYESCPDRITGRAAFAELQKACPDRSWRFVAIDVPYAETVAHRDTVKRLMRPHNTEMDLSIACALYFASRGQGMALDSQKGDTTPVPYITPARVLLSGLGADELFAGYGRHSVAFTRSGFEGLIEEIDLDVGRLGKRNLGRDNRVLAHWGRETRFPYLDEEFVSWVVQLPVWEKCGFGMDLPDDSNSLDHEKRALRLVAQRLGMPNVAREKKRAIQFGSRTAKMEKSKVKGTDALS